MAVRQLVSDCSPTPLGEQCRRPVDLASFLLAMAPSWLDKRRHQPKNDEPSHKPCHRIMADPAVHGIPHWHGVFAADHSQELENQPNLTICRFKAQPDESWAFLAADTKHLQPVSPILSTLRPPLRRSMRLCKQCQDLRGWVVSPWLQLSPVQGGNHIASALHSIRGEAIKTRPLTSLGMALSHSLAATCILFARFVSLFSPSRLCLSLTTSSFINRLTFTPSTRIRHCSSHTLTNMARRIKVLGGKPAYFVPSCMVIIHWLCCQKARRCATSAMSLPMPRKSTKLSGEILDARHPSEKTTACTISTMTVCPHTPDVATDYNDSFEF